MEDITLTNQNNLGNSTPATFVHDLIAGDNNALYRFTSEFAHFINNANNFVKSGISPLKKDFNDIKELIRRYEEINAQNVEEKLKEIQLFRKEITLDYTLLETEMLMKAIDNGSLKINDIMLRLPAIDKMNKHFIQETDLHEAIEMVLLKLKDMIPTGTSVIKDLGILSKIQCYPERIRLALRNILINAFQACRVKPSSKDNEITIVTKQRNDVAYICISDTGPGIPHSIQHKIFEPFFTTKGTEFNPGLGLFISACIIERHHGTLTVYSEEGNGAKFEITLPVKTMSGCALSERPDCKK